jgi:hypothetical protein
MVRHKAQPAGGTARAAARSELTLEVAALLASIEAINT